MSVLKLKASIRGIVNTTLTYTHYSPLTSSVLPFTSDDRQRFLKIRPGISTVLKKAHPARNRKKKTSGSLMQEKMWTRTSPRSSRDRAANISGNQTQKKMQNVYGVEDFLSASHLNETFCLRSAWTACLFPDSLLVLSSGLLILLLKPDINQFDILRNSC